MILSVGQQQVAVDANITVGVISFALHEARLDCEWFIENVSERRQRNHIFGLTETIDIKNKHNW